MVGHKGRSPVLSLEQRSGWQDKVRKQCLQRVQDQRQALLWQLRTGRPPHALAVQEAMSDIISDVSNRASQGQMLPARRSAEGSVLSTSLQHPTPSLSASNSASAFAAAPAHASASAAGAFLAAASPHTARKSAAVAGDEYYALSAAEYEDLMLAMQQSLLEGDEASESAVGARRAGQTVHEAEHCDDSDEDVAAMLDALSLHVMNRPGDSAVLCPICKVAYLQQHPTGVVSCTGQHALNLALLSGGSSALEELRDRMAGALESHALSACNGTADFSLHPLADSETDQLVLCCSHCQLWQPLL